MSERLKLVFLDTYKDGPDYLDPIFVPDTVELCEIFTTDGNGGIDIALLMQYTGWDYLVVPFKDEDYEKIMRILASYQIPHDKIIYISREQIKCEHFKEIEYIFDDTFIKTSAYYRLMNKYLQKGMGKYACLTVEDTTYVNVASDTAIMFEMFVSCENFSKDNIMRFYKEAHDRFSFTEKQDIFCDIGANIGTTSIYFKKKLDPDMKVLAFEPSKENYKLLRVNLILNDIDESDVTIARYAVSDKKAESVFEYNEENPGGSKLVSKEESLNCETVQTISFDQYVEENDVDIDRIKYIWIDIEGYEPLFFIGAEKTLEKINVPIVTEFTPESYAKLGSFNELYEVLCRLYKSFIIMQEDEGKIHDITELKIYENFDYQIDIMLLK